MTTARWITPLVAALLLPWSAQARPSLPEVRIDSGLLRGIVENEVAIFRGVPYAAPAVGALRWRPPAAPASWDGVRDTRVFGPICPQPRLPPPVGPEGAESEDCLTLNLWTPAHAASAKLPVMVWIHGGGFFLGAGSQPLYEGTALARQGAVVVTFNYRLGALGFLAHPALSREQAGGPLGNYGLLDQIAVLQWVQRNIAAFGGDPANVTIFGESAGGLSVQALMVSPLAAGLFSKAISQSGGGTAVFLRTREGQGPAEQFGEAWARSIGKGNASADELRKLAVTELMAQPFMSFPNVDGRVLIRSPGDAFRRGEQAAVPFMVGSNSYEGSLGLFTDAAAKAALGAQYDDLLAGYVMRAGSGEAALAMLRGEYYFVQPSRFLARQQASRNVPTWHYYFDQVAASARGTMPGAPHGGEIAYVFGTPGGFLVDWDDQDRRVARTVAGYWLHFARTGDPNGEGAPRWDQVDAAVPRPMRLGAEMGTAERNALDDRMESAAVTVAITNWEQ